MLSLINAVGRLMRGIFYIFTFQFDKISSRIDRNPGIAKSRYEDIIRNKRKSINEYMSAVAGIVAQEESKKQQSETIKKDLIRLTKIKDGAINKAKELSAALQSSGKSVEEIEKNAEYMQCKAAFTDVSSTISEKTNRCNDLAEDMKTLRGRIDGHLIQLQSLQREIENLKSEAADTVADIISATEEKQLNDLLNNVAIGSHDEELQKLREMRGQVKAEAKVSATMAGADNRKIEAEFEKYATESASSSEFEQLVGIKVPDADKIASMEATLKNMDAKETA